MAMLDWLVWGGWAATRPPASLLSVCRCSRCFGTPAALAQRRQRTESRPTSFILHAVMEVMQEGALAQNKSLGVTDGDAEREGISSDSKCVHLFFISGRRLQAQPHQAYLYGYVRHPDSWHFNFTSSWRNCKYVYWLRLYCRVCECMASDWLWWTNNGHTNL